MGFMSESERRKLVEQTVWVHFKGGSVRLVVPFWMPLESIVREARKTTITKNAFVESVVTDDGDVLWRASPAPTDTAEKEVGDG